MSSLPSAEKTVKHIKPGEKVIGYTTGKKERVIGELVARLDKTDERGNRFIIKTETGMPYRVRNIRRS